MKNLFWNREKEDITILGIFSIFAFIGLVSLGLAKFFSKIESLDLKREQKRLGQPIVNLHNGFIRVQEMNCRPATKGYSKRQLSKLTNLEKWIAKDATECGVTFQNVRLRKDRIKSYHPHFSIFMWRDDKDSNDPWVPLHIKEYNVENCELMIGSPTDKPKFVVIGGTCNLMDGIL